VLIANDANVGLHFLQNGVAPGTCTLHNEGMDPEQKREVLAFSQGMGPA
jgi:hypothetical protein